MVYHFREKRVSNQPTCQVPANVISLASDLQDIFEWSRTVWSSLEISRLFTGRIGAEDVNQDGDFFTLHRKQKIAWVLEQPPY